MLLFRSEEHVDNWCAQWGRGRGEAFPIEQMWALAHAWYGADRRDPAWRRRTLPEIRALFNELGYTSDFWQLPG